MDAKLKEFVQNLLEKQQEEQKETLAKEMEILRQNQISQEVKKSCCKEGNELFA